MAARIALHAVDPDEAERIAAAAPGPQDRWAADYPFEGDVVAVGMMLRAARELGDPRPFGYYRIDRLADGLAVGGIGFKGAPLDGRVEVGYGLAPSARGQGYAAEALTALLGLAAGRGVRTVLADTEHGNVASQRTLERAGFTPVRRDERLRYYERVLG